MKRKSKKIVVVIVTCLVIFIFIGLLFVYKHRTSYKSPNKRQIFKYDETNQFEEINKYKELMDIVKEHNIEASNGRKVRSITFNQY